MKICFISGHLDVTQEEFNNNYKSLIDKALDMNYYFIVGDAKGADTLAQSYLKGKTTNVTVYHMFELPRNNIGNFKTKGDFKSDIERDSQMTIDSDFDIAWIRPGRENSGTARNLKRRIK